MNIYGSIANVVKLLLDEIDKAEAKYGIALDELRDKAENMSQMIGSFTDEIIFKRVLDVLDIPIYITTKEGFATYINPAYEKLFNISSEEIIGSSFQSFISAQGLSINSELASTKVLETHSPESITLNRKVGNKENSLHICGKPIFSSNYPYEMEAVVVSIIDIEKNTSKKNNGLNPHSGDASEKILNEGNPLSYNLLIGETPQIKYIRRIIENVAATDATVLITGESGVGKEVVANCIYMESLRKSSKFIKINCAAISPNLLESELFGYVKGAFTGADAKGRDGLFLKADHATLFLDEIGEVPIPLQPKLLRAIQFGEIYPVGSDIPISTDVRIIAATNSNLKEKVRDGRFREDLYYRLNVIPLEIPPLRERVGDIERLVRFFLQEYNYKYNKNLKLSLDCIQVLQEYAWPGNVRELQNVIEYLVLCTEVENKLEADTVQRVLNFKSIDAGVPISLYTMLERYEKHMIVGALKRTNNQVEAARLLNIYPSTICRKIQKLGIKLKDYQDWDPPLK